MIRLTLLCLFIGMFLQLPAQQVYYGEPATLTSYHKAFEEWTDGVKTDASSTVNVEFTIFVSDSFIKVTEPDTFYTFQVTSNVTDQSGNYTFLTESGDRLKYLRGKGTFSILWKGDNRIMTYYL